MSFDYEQKGMNGALYIETGRNEQGELTGKLIGLIKGDSYSEIASKGLELLSQEKDGFLGATLEVDGWQVPVQKSTSVKNVLLEIEDRMNQIMPFTNGKTVGELSGKIKNGEKPTKMKAQKGNKHETPSQMGE